jgi:hypothetical protein
MPVLTGSDTSADNTVAAFARDTVIGIADFAARSLGGAKSPETAARDAAPPPVDPLLDLRLPDSLRAWLKPAAEALGLNIEDGTARDKYGHIQRRVTYLTNSGVRRTLLHISPKVLSDPNAYPSLGMVMWAMDENASVAVFSENSPGPILVNANVIDNLWKKRPMDSRYIAWGFVSELPALDLVDQIEFMRTRLDLETLTPRSQSAGAGEVTVKELDQVVAILLLGEFNDVRGRKSLLAQAGLDSVAAVVNLEGAPKSVGRELVIHLAQQQDRVPPDNHTALGALLRTVMMFPDISQTDVGWLKALIRRCEL